MGKKYIYSVTDKLTSLIKKNTVWLALLHSYGFL